MLTRVYEGKSSVVYTFDKVISDLSIKYYVKVPKWNFEAPDFDQKNSAWVYSIESL
jgi:hypothetical protein